MLCPIPLPVVLIWRSAEEDVVGSARSLIVGVRDVGGEVLIVTALGREAIETTTSAIYSDVVRWISVEPPLTEPGAWEAGLAASGGSAVGFCQTRGRYASRWAGSVLTALAEGADVAAGPVRLNGAAGLAGRAAHLCDYAVFDDPEAEPPGGVVACNLAFDRCDLAGVPTGLGLHKCALLAIEGIRVAWRPEMGATLTPFGMFRATGVARFHRGRHYAPLRSTPWPRWARLAASLGCLALPPLLFARLIRLPHVLRRHRRTLLLGSPWIAASLGLWSLGEMVGYRSRPGRSARFP